MLFASSGVAAAPHASRANTHVGDEVPLEDAIEYTKTFAVTIEEAIRRLSIQHDLGDVLAAAGDAAGPRLAGAWIAHDPEFGGMIRLTGIDEPHALRELLMDAPAPVHVQLGAPHSLEDLLAAQARVSQFVRTDLPETGVDIDVRRGVVRLLSATPVPERLLASARQVGGVPVEVRELRQPDRLAHTYGGKRLERQTDGQGECTTAFTVRNVVTGVTGVLTAGHCENELVYEETSDIEYNITRMGERWDGDQDWQWHTTPHPELPEFWVGGGGGYRDLVNTLPRAAMTGDYVCHYGIGTGYSCGWVQGIHFQPPGGCPGGCDAVWGLIEGPDLRCYFRDSGGPVFYISTGYGLVHSASFTGPGNGACDYVSFNTITAIEQGSLEVLIAP